MSHRWLSSGAPLSFSGRVWLSAACVLLMAGLALARWLEPNPKGFGTHQQLGLPECTFQILWNRPCPGCGMTTCFAHLVRGQWRAAARANPAGLLLGTICLVLIPWMGISVWRGVAVGVDRPLETLLGLLIATSFTACAVWLQRMWW